MSKRYSKPRRELLTTQEIQAVLDRAIFNPNKTKKPLTEKEIRKEELAALKAHNSALVKHWRPLEDINSKLRKSRVSQILNKKRNEDKALVDEVYRNDEITYDGRAVSSFNKDGVFTEAASVEQDTIKQIINALPATFRKEAKKVHGDVWRNKVEAGLKSIIFYVDNSLVNIQLATLDEDGIRAAASAAISIARAADGYSYSEPPGRPQHDFRWQCKQMRIKQRETLALIEIATGLVGGNKMQSKFAGSCSKERREGERARTQEWMNSSCLSLPILKTINGKTVTEYISIPLNEGGNTKYKSLSEFYGFILAIKALADEESRKWALVTLTGAAHMHPNSPHFDGHTTPREVNRFLSKTKKSVNDTLLNWGCKMTGAGTREAHKSATPHAHFAIAYDCKQKAVNQIRSLHKFCGKRVVIFGKEKDLWHKDWRDDLEFLDGKSPEQMIDEFEDAIFQNAWERHSYSLERDDKTGRLTMDTKNDVISGVGVDIRKGKTGEDASNFASYIMVYVMKSFGVDIDKLPADKEAKEKAIRDQVEAGGDIAFDAWRSAHQIRTREIFGLPARTPFKLLRKVRTAIDDAGLEKARQIAINNNHTAYIKLQGGLNGGRNQATLQTARKVKNSNYALRPDMKRSVITGVTRIEQFEYQKYITSSITRIVLVPFCAAYIKTRIDGITIKTNKVDKKNEFGTTAKAVNAKLKSSDLLEKQKLPIFDRKSHAVIPNYPRRADFNSEHQNGSEIDNDFGESHHDNDRKVSILITKTASKEEIAEKARALKCSALSKTSLPNRYAF